MRNPLLPKIAAAAAALALCAPALARAPEGPAKGAGGPAPAFVGYWKTEKKDYFREVVLMRIYHVGGKDYKAEVIWQYFAQPDNVRPYESLISVGKRTYSLFAPHSKALISRHTMVTGCALKDADTIACVLEDYRRLSNEEGEALATEMLESKRQLEQPR